MTPEQAVRTAGLADVAARPRRRLNWWVAGFWISTTGLWGVALGYGAYRVWEWWGG